MRELLISGRNRYGSSTFPDELQRTVGHSFQLLIGKFVFNLYIDILIFPRQGNDIL